jgi:dUTP pyrophosphatase
MCVCQNKIDVKVKLLSNSAIIPEYQTKGSVGFDLHSTRDFIIYPNETVLVPTGISVSIPDGYEIQIRPRSGLAVKHGITVLNAPGTIDSDYRGEIKVALINLGSRDVSFKLGDRIAQAVIAPVVKGNFTQVDTLDETERGSCGFGSTGM